LLKKLGGVNGKNMEIGTHWQVFTKLANEKRKHSSQKINGKISGEKLRAG
jgi:hypothetical protein